MLSISQKSRDPSSVLGVDVHLGEDEWGNEGVGGYVGDGRVELGLRVSLCTRGTSVTSFSPCLCMDEAKTYGYNGNTRAKLSSSSFDSDERGEQQGKASKLG